ncbi:MAG: YCF48-related protein [Candidatus Sulfotelmatobacter sp.]
MQDIPKIVVKRLQGIAVANPHPAPDLLSAFAERSLAQSERALMLDHLARCPECRQILELAIPVTETETVPSIRSVRRGWLSGPALRWGFATAAILTLVSGGVLQYAHQHRDHELASSSAPQAKLTAEQGFAATPGETEPTARSQQPPVQEPKSAAGNAQTVTRSQSAPAKSDLQKARESGLSVGMKSEAKTEAMARPRTSDQLIQNQAAAASQYQSYTSSDVVKAKAAVPAQASGDSAPAFAPPDIAPPNIGQQTTQSLTQPASPRWTINAAGGLQRSFDAGKTWEDVNVNAEAGQAQTKLVFRAVAVIGPEVWAGGSGAMLYHSSDSGTLWQQVFPSTVGAQPAGDITKIEFSSPQQGEITTSAGEIWTTSDSGQTWRRQP